ncbi:MAG: hypothetical protein J2P25_03855 [Nocardiopsaceae bacterium]|nr:hypothetical protein [Nocardiopsaceae bacterium]
MTTKFTVDLTTLGEAANGVKGVVADASQIDLSNVNAGFNVTGDGALATALSNFLDKWHYGLSNLTSDSQKITGMLDYAQKAYTAYEEANKQAASKNGTLSGTVPGADPGEAQ